MIRENWSRHIASAALYNEEGKRTGVKYLYSKTEIQQYCDWCARRRLEPHLRYITAAQRGIKGY